MKTDPMQYLRIAKIEVYDKDEINDLISDLENEFEDLEAELKTAQEEVEHLEDRVSELEDQLQAYQVWGWR